MTLKKTVVICITALICTLMLSYSVLRLTGNDENIQYTPESTSTDTQSPMKYENVKYMGSSDGSVILLDIEDGTIYSINSNGSGLFKIYKTNLKEAGTFRVD